MDIFYDALRKTQTLVLTREDAALSDFFSQFYEIKNFSDGYDAAQTLTYCESLDEKLAVAVRSKYLWSAAPVAVEIRKSLPPECVLIEGRDLKQEYIKRFLGNCSA